MLQRTPGPVKKKSCGAAYSSLKQFPKLFILYSFLDQRVYMDGHINAGPFLVCSYEVSKMHVECGLYWPVSHKVRFRYI